MTAIPSTTAIHEPKVAGSAAVARSDASPRKGFQADSLALGMIVVLGLTVVQRGVGFLRGIWFCRLMDDVDVGQWAMAFGFITLATPVMLLGIPGCLPRYVETYRGRGQLGPFVRRIATATISLVLIGCAAMMLFPDRFGWFIFLQPQATSLIGGVAAAVLAMVFFNFINDLNSALRQVRVVSMMQFAQGVGFTIGGVLWLSGGGGLLGLVLTFAMTTTLATAPGLWSLCRGWSAMPAGEESFDAAAMWRRLMPFAAAVWAMNLIGNSFDMSDRYMILHLMPGDDQVGQAAVGQYHSSRIVPMLFTSLATMIGGILLPYLTADWEAGKIDAVRQRVQQSLLAISSVFTLMAAIIVIGSPFFFGNLLQGRYADGMSLMPMAFVFSIWATLITIGQNYLWVVEKGKLISIAFAVGLGFNLVMNAMWIPAHGLYGAVVATLLSHLVVLIGVWLAMIRYGFPRHHRTVLVAMLPATLLAGPWVAILCVVVLLLSSDDAKRFIESYGKPDPSAC